jgi:glycosyltransferase involved in cell wall biosynthesis
MNTPAIPQVLFLAPVEPWCRENGSSIIIADLLEGLTHVGGARLFPVFLRHPPSGCRPTAPTVNRGVQLGLQGLPRWYSILKAIALGSSPIRMRFANRKVEFEVARSMEGAGFVPSVVHVEHLPLIDIGLMVARKYRCPLVYREHNIEAQLLERRLNMNGPFARALLRRSALAEADAIKSCTVTLCISDNDLHWVHSRVPSADARLFPCSLLLDRYDVFAAEPRSDQPQIGFAGGLDWVPNEAGLKWFVDEVLSRICRAVPQARLAVLARGARNRPWLATNPNVSILDEGSDARSLFARSWVSIAPLLQGGGVRIKIPESLALGCPVVATTIGAEGHELPGLIRADDPEAYATACISHLSKPPGASAREGLRAAVEARHGAHGLAGDLIALWTRLVQSERVVAA